MNRTAPSGELSAGRVPVNSRAREPLSSAEAIANGFARTL
eukprot:CAMPEP_0195603288 /NCGR_PEP_ID=MMETSP0815-20121206/6049_1 /TAXON_ID=97485 /ORGANISM="Prymnesium parvum, Strain Texoma1" /LENGTH=39 /DNA_ID= /DNA_START= /DNA_END= /DNA_ORIENTATION=